MTGKDLDEMLRSIKILKGKFAELTGNHPSTISKWTKHEGPFSEIVEERILEGLELAKKFKEGNLNSSEKMLSVSNIPGSAGRQYQYIKDDDFERNAWFAEIMLPIFSKLQRGEIYKLFPVEGGSMMTSIYPGDWLLCKRDNALNIKDGRVYVLHLNVPEMKDYRPTGIWVKRCFLRDHHVTCKSDNINSTEPYPTFHLPISKITECWYPVYLFTGQIVDPNKDLYEKINALEKRLELLEITNNKAVLK